MNIKKILYPILKTLLGLVFIFSGFVKAVDPLGSTYKIEDYLEAFGMDIFSGLALPAAILLCAIEFIIGINFLFNCNIKKTSILSLLFMAVMTPLTLYIAIANPVTDCGCFGDALVISNWQTFFKNIVLSTIAIIIFLWIKDCQVDRISKRSQWIITAFAFVTICSISVYCIKHLPIIDFRPYKIGANIPEGMAIPEDAEADVYEMSFIYEKDGVQKVFTEDNLPDASWTFIDSESKLIKKGYEPPIHDFSLESDEYGDITEDMLADESYTFLVISSKLEKANIEGAKKLQNAYEFAERNNYNFYAMTSSLDDAIEDYKAQTGAQYDFFSSDEITLKTIVRSNPGLVLIKEGNVINKWHYNDLPDFSQVDNLETSSLGEMPTVNNWKTVFLSLILLIIVPITIFYGISMKFKL